MTNTCAIFVTVNYIVPNHIFSGQTRHLKHRISTFILYKGAPNAVMALYIAAHHRDFLRNIDEVLTSRELKEFNSLFRSFCSQKSLDKLNSLEVKPRPFKPVSRQIRFILKIDTAILIG